MEYWGFLEGDVKIFFSERDIKKNPVLLTCADICTILIVNGNDIIQIGTMLYI